ncbi:hypothetical protein LDENG_00207270, partial [Lucifuga dentata]
LPFLFSLCLRTRLPPLLLRPTDHTTHFACLSPNIYSFHTHKVNDNHFPKHTTGTVN